jgi:hypothetical protein
MKPVDLDDYAALQHDLAYQEATTMQDLNRADDEFQDRLKWNSIHNIIGKVGIHARKILQLDMRGNDPINVIKTRNYMHDRGDWDLPMLQEQWKQKERRNRFGFP